MNELLRKFANDREVQAVAALVLLDFVFGVGAAFKTKTFRLSYLTDFLRNDVLGKLVPYFAVMAVVTVGGDVSVGGVNIQDVVGVAVIAALSSSILSSLNDLGFWKSAPAEIAGADPATPLIAPPK